MGIIKENCHYCGMELAFRTTTCSYCGQVQPQHKKKPLKPIVSAVKNTSSPTQASVQAPVGQMETVLSALRQIQAQTTQQQSQKSSYKKQTSSPSPKMTSTKKKSGKLFVFFYVGLFFWWSFFKPILDSFIMPQGIFGTQLGEGQPIVASAILFFTIVFFCRGTFRVWLAQIATGLSAFVLLVKPWLFPLQYTWQTSDGHMGFFEYSYTSETHLCFVAPGMILAVIAFILSATLAGRMTR